MTRQWITRQKFWLHLEASERRLHQELASTVTHPIHEYTEERVAVLLAKAHENARLSWPEEMN